MPTTNSGAYPLPFRSSEGLRPRADRRSLPARDQLVTRVRGEFTEMPCLSLTLPQAMRLFGLREDICGRVLAALVTDGVLWKRDDDRYIPRAAGL
jgi:hypothetical protein